MSIKRSFVTSVTALLIVSVPAIANVLGDLQTFAPNTDGLDFISVHTSRPLNQGFFAVGGHLSLAKDHFRVFRDLNTQEKENYKDTLGEFDFDFAYAFTKKMSVFFAVPNLIYYKPDSGQEYIASATRGAHTYRPGIKWTVGQDASEFALLASVDIPNVDNSPFTGVNSKPIYNLELAKTFRTKETVAYGVNVGYRIRDPDQTPADARMFPLDDQFIFSFGRSAPLASKSRWILEGIFSTPAKKAPYNKALDASSADILLGMKHRLMRNLNLDWGGTFEPGLDTMAPRWRVFAGLVYYFNPGWFSSDPTAPPPPPPPAEVVPEESVQAAETESVRGAFEVPKLEVDPKTAEVFEGTRVKIRARGGVPPYSFKLVQGKGALNVRTGLYRASFSEEVAEIEVSDNSNQIEVSRISVKASPKPDELIRIKNLNFKFNTDVLIPSSQKEIQRIVGLLKKKTIKRIIVEGHTDNVGSDQYNLDLSQRRADAVANILERRLSLPSDKVTAIGFGEGRPIFGNETAKGRLGNRRVDLKVYWQK